MARPHLALPVVHPLILAQLFSGKQLYLIPWAGVKDVEQGVMRKLDKMIRLQPRNLVVDVTTGNLCAPQCDHQPPRYAEAQTSTPSS